MGEALDRVLCGDDMCTGIYGPDGRCGTCGRGVRDDDPSGLRAEVAALVASVGGETTQAAQTGTPTVAAPEVPSAPIDAVEVASQIAGASDAVAGTGAPHGGGEDVLDEAREPCADDMCTGIYGPQGLCGTCGRAKS